MSLGLFIGRLNPPHIGHTSIIKQALEENDKVLVLIGTKTDLDIDNPLSFLQIKDLLKSLFKQKNNLSIFELENRESDSEWILDIINILNNFEDVDIHIYVGDFENDSAYNTIKKYESYFKTFNLKYINKNRNNSFVNHLQNKIPISATTLRKAIRESDFDLVSKLTDKQIFNHLKKIKI